jgi:hypothetical protein
MTTRPYDLTAEQVRAALGGRLRRIVAPLKVQPAKGQFARLYRTTKIDWQIYEKSGLVVSSHRLPYAPGDSLWGREVWHPTLLGDWPFVEYKTDSGGDEYLGNSRPITIDQFDRVDSERRGWRSPVTMPRWASRWTLTVGEVRVCRAKEVTDAEAIETGVGPLCHPLGRTDLLWVGTEEHCRAPSLEFKRLWIADHGPGAWDRNDWCVSAAVETRKGNCDE